MLSIFPHFKTVSVLALTLILLIVTGCETAPVTPAKGAYTTSKSGIQLAEVKVKEAMTQTSPARDLLLLEAAQLFSSEQKYRKAGTILGMIKENVLSADSRVLYTVLSGELALKQQNLENTQQFLLRPINPDTLANQSAELRLRWHRTRGEAFALTGATSKGIFELTRAASLVRDGNAEKVALHDTIWRLVGELSDDELSEGTYQSSDEVMAGWYQLGYISRQTRDDITLFIQAIRKWQRENPGHPAAYTPPSTLRRLSELTVTSPDKIAVLLPYGGDFELATQTLTDGILSAYYDSLANGAEVPELRFYDTNAESIVSLYRRAVNEGAQLVLGPLRREKLAELMAEPAIPVPVLGLNYVEDLPNPHDNFYQFGLSIRDEAEQIRNQGWSMGYRSALVITPAGRMGESASDAFVSGWQQGGGKIIGNVIYNNSDHDYTELLMPPLLIKQSSERAARLKRLLGKNVEYTPRRRGDVDMVLLVAYPDRGRQIKPALDFLYASDLPVFSTSQLYSGTANPGLDRDLDDIVFTAMPWSTTASNKSRLKPRNNLPAAYKNLFAMGVDAYRLHQWLELLKTLPEDEISGQSGYLSMVPENYIKRRLPWARFKQGQATTAPEFLPATTLAP